MIISEKIFELLDKKNISRKQFSEETGIAQSTISDWKRKKTNPAADKIMAICDALQVTPVQLLADDRDGLEADGAAAEAETDYLMVRRGSEEYILIEKYRKLEKGIRGICRHWQRTGNLCKVYGLYIRKFSVTVQRPSGLLFLFRGGNISGLKSLFAQSG